MLEAAFIISTVFCAVVVQSAPQSLPAPAHGAESETISLEGLNYLLRRAEQLFRSPDFNGGGGGAETNEEIYSKLRPPTNEPYNFYLPVFTYDHNVDGIKIDQNSKNLLKFSPPVNSHEHNYYAAKPKKIPKKFSSAVKHVNIHKSQNSENQQNEWDAIYNNDRRNNYNDQDHTNNDQQHKIIFDDSYFGVDAHIPVPDIIEQAYNTPVADTGRNSKKTSQKFDDMNDEREDGEKDLPTIIPKEQEQRMEYQMHGFDGPKSYKFGYDTGKGKDRQYRFEERNNEGNVKGQYGYIDDNGKMKVVKYLSSVENGFRIIN